MENKELSRIRELLEFLVKKEISTALQELSPKEREIYDLTGKIGQTKIISKTKTSSKTISKLWKGLEEKGLLIKDGKGYKKVV